MDIKYRILNRENSLFTDDININKKEIYSKLNNAKILVIGGAGTIGQATVKQIYKYEPKSIDVVDTSENNLVELVRDIRSSINNLNINLRTFAIDCGSEIFENFLNNEGIYDYIFNLSALKHVRSEKDPYTLLRMIEVNVINTVKIINYLKNNKSKNYFTVSTDKAANPTSLMGASKKIMEMYLMRNSDSHPVSMARFANVVFSDGSLLYGLTNRFNKKQPIAAPIDIERYFISPQESGDLCLLSGIVGENRDIFFPKQNEKLKLIKFPDLIRKFLVENGFEPYECDSEDEARGKMQELFSKRKWPCFFFNSDTTGEKKFEEFFTQNETVNLNKFESIGIIKNSLLKDEIKFYNFLEEVEIIKKSKHLDKNKITKLILTMVPELKHSELDKNLDQKM